MQQIIGLLLIALVCVAYYIQSKRTCYELYIWKEETKGRKLFAGYFNSLSDIREFLDINPHTDYKLKVVKRMKYVKQISKIDELELRRKIKIDEIYYTCQGQQSSFEEAIAESKKRIEITNKILSCNNQIN